MCKQVPIFVFLVFTAMAPAGPLTVGAAQVDVTPARGTPMAGYYSFRASEGTHDPLYANAIVLEKDGVKVALVSLDLIGTTQSSVKEARAIILSKTGIPATHVMVSATHSHTGPVLNDDRVRDEAFGGGNALARQYMKELPAKIAQAVAEADTKRVPARASRGIGREAGLAFNRRFHMKDGTVGWNPGKLNPNIIKPAGPTDDDVPVVVFETLEGKPICVYVNFAMHLDTVGGLYCSADYPYMLSKCLSAAKGEGLVTCFTIGTAGDINHINVAHKLPQKGHGEAARIGTRLAAEVLRTWDTLSPCGDGPLRATSETVPRPLADFTPEELDTARDVAEKVRKEAKPLPKFLEQVRAFRVLDCSARLGKPLDVEVQVISLGKDLAWVSLPGEIFVELGIAIKKDSPFKQTMIAELANGSIGYVPTKAAYGQGNYEVISARCAAGSGELLVQCALRQLRGQGKE